jgi:monoamine oxidase
VLQQNGIAFTPALPAAITDAIQSIGFGDTTKLTLWVTGTIPYFQILSTKGVFRFWQHKRADETILVGYTGGDAATELTNMKEREVVQRAIMELRDALDPHIEDQIVYAKHFTWSDNPYVRGSYSYPKVGMGNAREVLGEPVEDTLYFAGEATHTGGHSAMVHGALEMGYKTAERIVNA